MDGILVINKPQNMTSRDVVNIATKVCQTKKIGHTGTLDPLATGVLVLAVGKATKIIELLTSDEKEYIAESKLGIQTDTLDITGNVQETKEIEDIDLSLLKKSLSSMKGSYLQQVPMYSAVKINGKRLYQYAREKQVVSLPKREVTIKEIELKELNFPYFTFFTHVSKGTYIRSLINDIGQKMDIPCTMSNLTRVKQGIFSIDEAYTIEDLQQGNIKFISIKEALKNYPMEKVSQDIEKRIKNGQKLKKHGRHLNPYLVILNEKDEVIAIYQDDPKNQDLIKPWKIISTK